MEQTTQVKSNKTGLIIVALIIVAAIAVGAFFLLGSNSGEEVSASKAFLNTTDAMGEELTVMGDELEFVKFFEDFETSQYSFGTDISGVSMELALDYASKQMKLSADMAGIGGAALISDKAITLETSLLPNAYGVSLEDLFTNVENMGGALPEGFDKEMSLDLFAFDFSMYEELEKITHKNWESILNTLLSEETEDAVVMIAGEEKTLPTYIVTFNTEELRGALEAYVEEIFTNQQLVDYFDTYFAYTNALISLGADVTYTGVTFTSTEELKSVYLEIVNMIITSLETEEGVSFKVSLDNGKVAQMSFGTDENPIKVTFESPENPLSKITLEMEGQSASVGVTLIDGVFEVLVIDTVGAEALRFTYDSNSNQDNLTMAYQGIEVPAITVDMSEENVIRFAYEEGGFGLVEFFVEKDNLPADWFNQDSYIDVFNMTDAEMMELSNLLSMFMG